MKNVKNIDTVRERERERELQFKEKRNFISRQNYWIEWKEKSKNIYSRGITLVALVISIIILIILGTITINFAFGNNGLITKANEAKQMQELSTYQEELGMFITSKQIENSDFEPTSLTSGYNSLVYNTQEEGETGTIYDIITTLKGGSFNGKIEIIKGKLLLNSQDTTEIEIAKTMGIEVNPYKIENGVLLSSNSNLALMDENGSLTIPDTVQEIGAGAFADLSGLKTVIIPENVKKININAFKNNKELERVILQDGIERIDTSAFQNCENLKSINLPESLTYLGATCFYNCKSLQEITIPSQIQIIESHTFCGCTNLSKVELPENLTTLEVRAFFKCQKLSYLYLPKNVNSIGSDVFGECQELTLEVNQENTSYVYDEQSDMLLTKNRENIVYISYKVLHENNTLIIPEGVKELQILIDGGSITKVELPASLSKIEAHNLPANVNEIELNSNNQTFTIENKCLYTKDKKELIICYNKNDTVTLIDGVEIIRERAFKQAPTLKNIKLPDSVTTIKDYAFIKNYQLENLQIGKNVKDISSIFKYHNFAGQVTIDSNNENYTIENNILYNKDKTELIAVMYQIDGKFIVNNSVRKIGSNSFVVQTKMTEIQLPNNLEEIGHIAFRESSIVDIFVPSSVNKIANSAFAGMDSLEKIQIDKKEGEIQGSPWGAIKGDRIVEWLK